MTSQLSLDELIVNGGISHNYRARVKKELVDATGLCPNLRPSLQTYMDNTGNELLLIALMGTIPMVYRGATYNTPINIFLPSEYPEKAPYVYVRPNAKMTVKLDHPNVTRNGECMHSYFRFWNSSFNTLVGALKMLSDDFSKIPPLLSKAEPPSSFASGGGGGYTLKSPSATPTSLGGGSSCSVSVTSKTPYPPPYVQPSRPIPIVAVPKPSPREELLEKVRCRISHDSEPAIDLQKRLYNAEVELTRELAYLKEMEKAYPQLAAEMDEMKTKCDEESAAIEAELKEFTALKERGDGPALADTVVSVDGLSEQALTESAKRDALEDVMYELTRAIRPDNCDSVLRLIRKCASDQFISLALLKKIDSSPQDTREPPRK